MLFTFPTRVGYVDDNAHIQSNYTGRLADHTKLGVANISQSLGVSVATEA